MKENDETIGNATIIDDQLAGVPAKKIIREGRSSTFVDFLLIHKGFVYYLTGEKYNLPPEHPTFNEEAGYNFTGKETEKILRSLW